MQKEILLVLEHDGYRPKVKGYVFVSKLLKEMVEEQIQSLFSVGFEKEGINYVIRS